MSTPSEKTIFLAAIELSTPEERRRYLEQACGGDRELREAVEALLAANERTNLLDSIPEPAAALRARFQGDAKSTDSPANGSASAPPAITEGPGTVLGPYRLMEQIGEGGFGYVFVAEQQQPVRRKVALKVVKPGMDTREVIARFEAERQALAMMNHPNIAQVFDAGTTASGRPYFVMELVRGVAITEFCQESDVAIRQRLELFIDVCLAVQHAHQKGIIHRDLKPSNVLVTLHDGRPVVKVIDFGVAKAMGEPLTDKTIYTRLAQVIGTPLYMSPEQVELSGLDVDTRSDIYSLGVLLYELLTGRTPLDRARLHSVPLDELRRIIREEEPPRPSLVLTTQERRTPTVAIAGKKGTVPICAKHPPGRSGKWGLSPFSPVRRAAALTVQGDLDWIVMKALEKDRTRRYQTAVELAADVRRYLDEEPVMARPPSALYRFSKFARRNKAFLTTALLVVGALVLGTAVSTWQAIRATTARAEADSLRQEAVRFAENLKQANVLLDNARANADGERWAAAYEQYTKATELEPDHYPVWSGGASLLVRLGLWKRAAADYAKALELRAAANNPGWWGVPQLFLYAGDTATYSAASSQMLEQFEKSPDGFFKASALRGCLVDARPQADPEGLVRLAESLVSQSRQGPFGRKTFGGGPRGGPWDGPFSRGPGPPPGGDRGPPPGPGGGPPGREFRGPPAPGVPREVAVYVAGLAHYRAGHAERAIAYLQESVRPGMGGRNQETGYPVLAMAYHRAGRAKEAQVALAQAKKASDRWLDEMDQGAVGWTPVPWADLVEFFLLHREATAVVTGAAPKDEPRLATLEQRALDAIEGR